MPVPVGLGNIVSFIPKPGIFDFVVKDKIELVINYSPGFRICLDKIVPAQGKCAVAVIFRSIFFRVFFEKFHVFFGRKVPFSMIPDIGEIINSSNRL